GAALAAGTACDLTDEAPVAEHRAAVRATPHALRIVRVELVDPHLTTRVYGVCTDITGYLNEALAEAVTGDADGDGLFDLSLVPVFRPLAVTGTTDLELHAAECRTGSGQVSCRRGDFVVETRSVHHQSGTCLTAVNDT